MNKPLSQPGLWIASLEAGEAALEAAVVGEVGEVTGAVTSVTASAIPRHRSEIRGKGRMEPTGIADRRGRTKGR